MNPLHLSLLNTMELWPAESIWEQLSPRLPGFTVEVLPEVDSSNTELMRRARAGRSEPTLLAPKDRADTPKIPSQKKKKKKADKKAKKAKKA